MTHVRRLAVGLFALSLHVAGCDKPKPAPPPTTAPATQASTRPTTKPAPFDYVAVVREKYPKVAATQPLGVPVDLIDAGHFVLTDPIYLCPRGDLWVTRREAPPTEQVLWKSDDEQIHLVREPVLFVQWLVDEDGKGLARPVVRRSDGGFEWIDREGRRATTAGRNYRWSDAFGWGEDKVVAPTDKGVAIFTFTPEFGETYHEIVTESDANPPQVALGPTGLFAWSPWDAGKPGSAGVARLVDGKWSPLGPDQGWPAKVLHLVPLLDGSVLQLAREDASGAAEGPVKLAMTAGESSATVDEVAITKLVEQLSADEPEKREQAYAELTRYGNASWPILEKLLEDQPAEARMRMQELLRNRIEPTLGGRAPVDGKMVVADRFNDGGVLLYLPSGVRVPPPRSSDPTRVVKPAWISIRPGRAIEMLEPVLVHEADPGKQTFFAYGDEWLVSDEVQGPRRLYGNHLEELVEKPEFKFAHVVGFDRRGRWLFRKSPTDTETLVVDPTVPDPTPKLPIWLLNISRGMVGWTAAGYPVIKGSNTLVKTRDAWVLLDSGWQPLNLQKEQLLTELPPAEKSQEVSGAAPATTTASTSPTTTQRVLGPPILTDADGRRYFDGKESLIAIDKDGSEVTWPLPANAVGQGPVFLIRTAEGMLFLFNQKGRVVRIKPTPGEAEPFTVEAVFTKRVPAAEKLTRVWLDPAGRIVMIYNVNKIAVMFPGGRIPKAIADLIPAKELE